MANFQTSKDLIDDILFRNGEPIDRTSDFDIAAIRYLNRAYFGLLKGGASFVPEIQEDWWFFMKNPPGTIILQPAITGNVSVTNNSNSITFGAAVTPSVAGWHLFITGTGGTSDVFRILTHTAGTTTATLDSVYTGTTNAAIAYRLAKLEYDLAPDFFKFTSPIRVSRNNRIVITGISATKLDEKFPIGSASSGIPVNFAMVGNSRIRFSHYGSNIASDFIRLEYDYLFRPTALVDSVTDIPVVPEESRYVLSDIATAFVAIDRSDSKSTIFVEIAKNSLISLKNENREKLLSMSQRVLKASPRLIDQATPDSVIASSTS